MRNWWWWVLGGGAVLWAINKAQADAPETRVEGILNVSITWKPGTNTMAAVSAGLNAIQTLGSCGGPQVISAVGAPAVAGSVVTSATNTLWTHNRLGPIKDSVRACFLKALRAVDPNITDVQATRVS
jgi:hypothetical protein